MLVDFILIAFTIQSMEKEKYKKLPPTVASYRSIDSAEND